jgi:DNA-binding GntR family transcriptional regulator
MATALQTFTPVRSASLVDQVWSQLRRMILTGRLSAGTRLVELEIAAQMATSQGSVREALQRLEQDGLVERRGRRGTFVTEVSIDEVREIFAVRELMEGFAARSTAHSITESQITELEGLITDMHTAGRSGDMVALVDADMAFHHQICLWSGRPALTRAWIPLHTQLQRFIVTTHPHYFTQLEEIADTHRPILYALRTRNPERAGQAIEEHMALIWSRIAADSTPHETDTTPS